MLHNEESVFVLLACHYYGDQIKWVEWVGDAACMGEKRNVYRVKGKVFPLQA
jgi:hypothetical protein